MEKVKFMFDPRCPWCYQASRWVRRLEALGEIELDYGLYCLELSNLPVGEDEIALKDTARSANALRAAVGIRRAEGSKAIGRYYEALGDRVWETDTPMRNRDEAVVGAAEAAGFSRALVEEAVNDPTTWDEVLAEHHDLVKNKGGIGVPTVILDGGEGTALFGPVISRLPSDEDAVELWRHVSWLGRYGTFFELKLHRTEQPDLPGWKVGAAGLTFGPRPWVSMFQEEWKAGQSEEQIAPA
jgi:2-hydroxychromene-2-carboxylate isomerase